jgi:hypothetical protein
MMRLRRASVIVPLSLLAWAATASAECAWVVWHGGLNPPPGIQPWEVWQPTQSYSKEQPCQAYADRMNDLGKRDTSQYKFTCVCLPDTVDPRGPKGK